MKVTVDEDLCIGCELCIEECPEIFEMQDDIAVTKIGTDAEVPEEFEETCKEAADTCPVDAIIIEE